MSVLRALKSLILGETWTLPLGVAIVVAAGALARHYAPDAWHDFGGFVLVVGVLAVLVVALPRPGA